MKRFLDVDDAWLRALTRRRRAERALARPTARFAGTGPEFRPPAANQSPGGIISIRQSLLKSGRLGQLRLAQNGRCYLCCRRFGSALKDTVEHVKPRKAGGYNAGNVLLACWPCNQAKGSRQPRPCELIYLAAVNTMLGLRHAA